MRAAIGDSDYVVALEVGGRAMTTPALAQSLAARMTGGKNLALLVGGPDGLDAGLSAKADFRWSLSPLTWPHGLMRVMVAEQLYRAHTVLIGHPSTAPDNPHRLSSRLNGLRRHRPRLGLGTP